MANNRMYLVCTQCLQTPDVPWEDCHLYLAKYYPHQGWYFNRDPGKTETELGKFLETHSHKSLFGQDFAVVYDTMIPGFPKEKSDILRKVSKSLSERK